MEHRSEATSSLETASAVLKKKLAAGLRQVFFPEQGALSDEEVVNMYTRWTKGVPQQFQDSLFQILSDETPWVQENHPVLPPHYQTLQKGERVLALRSPQIYKQDLCVFFGMGSRNLVIVDFIQPQNGRGSWVLECWDKQKECLKRIPLDNLSLATDVKDARVIFYDGISGAIQWEDSALPLDNSHRKMAEILAPHLNGESKEVLDLGAGTGLTEEHLAGTSAQFTCLDASSGMLGFMQLKKLPNVRESRHFHLGDGNTLPYESDSFDVVISNGCFYYLPSLKFTALEVARVLRPGGIFSFSIEEPVGQFNRDFFPIRNAALNVEGAHVSFPEINEAERLTPVLAGLQDGYMRAKEAKYRGMYAYYHGLQDVSNILFRSSFEAVRSERHFVHLEPFFGKEIHFTYVTARKRGEV